LIAHEESLHAQPGRGIALLEPAPSLWQAHAMNATTTLDSANRVVITREMRKAAGIISGQKLHVQASPGFLILSVPTVPATIVRKGKLKVIDAPLPDFDLSEAVDRARRYTR
jgi:hypothetical protein